MILNIIPRYSVLCTAFHDTESSRLHSDSRIVISSIIATTRGGAYTNKQQVKHLMSARSASTAYASAPRIHES